MSMTASVWRLRCIFQGCLPTLTYIKLGAHLVLELGLTQLQMTHKPILRGEIGARARGEIGARAWRVCGQTRGGGWASTFGARPLGESACFVKPIKA